MSTTTVNISAAQVKDLREKTGAPMMDCKQALTEAKGDMEQAVVIPVSYTHLDVYKRQGCAKRSD